MSLAYEAAERILAVRRLRRGGVTVPAIAARLSVSESTVRRSIRAWNKIAARRVVLDVERDLNEDLAVLADDSRRIDCALAETTDGSVVAALIGRRAQSLKVRHTILRDIGARTVRPQNVIDLATLERVKHLPTEQVALELRDRAQRLLEVMNFQPPPIEY